MVEGRRFMKIAKSIVMCALVVGLTTPGFAADSSESKIRRSSEMKAQAELLRDQANALREAAELKGHPGGARVQAKKLDTKADALEKHARSLDGDQWPPKED